MSGLSPSIFNSKAYWHSFKVINLFENHHQDKDKDYAEPLRRVRVGDIRDEEAGIQD